MTTPQKVPPLIYATITKCPMLEPSHGLRVKNGDDDSIVIYFIDPSSSIHTTSTSNKDDTPAPSLTEGCEILSINGHRLRSPKKCREMLDYYMAARGTCDIITSAGDRPRGTTYVMAKDADGNKEDLFSAKSKDDDKIDGLQLQDRGGSIRVVGDPAASSGFFSKLKIRRGDYIWYIDGKEIRTIEDARRALIEAKGGLIPIMTYNIFRRLKTAIITDTSREIEVNNKKIGKKGGVVRIEDDYDIYEKLGEGAYAIVKKATHKKTGQTYALKIVERSNLDASMESALKDEIFILNDLNHPNVMNLKEVVLTINNYFLVTEYLEGGELFDRIVEKNTYTESEARDVCKVLFEGLKYCHSKGVAHRDLKPENLLLQYKESDSEIKIADFGFAKIASSEHSLTTTCGTPGYVAPEILRLEKYGTKSDMWSIGVIIFIMMGGYPPFYAETQKEIFRMTKRGDFSFNEREWGHISSEAKDMISSLLVTDPDKRASAEEILQHDWMMEDSEKLGRKTLDKSQQGLKSYLARRRFKKAIHSVMFIKSFGGDAAFTGKDKNKSIQVQASFRLK